MRFPYGKLVFLLLKLFVVGVILFYGISFTIEGYRLMFQRLPPETKPPFLAELKPKYGAKWGDLKISMKPKNAFVIGEPIFTTIEISLSLMPNETASVIIVFPESISILKEWMWANFSTYEQPIVLWGNFSNNILRQDLIIWYPHEGVFGVNITIVRFGFHPELYKFYYPNIVHIKSYTYLEERRNAQLTLALNKMILGLTIITISPVAINIIGLVESFLDLYKKRYEIK